MAITIYDVATAAGVSPATVSRVLSGATMVAPDTAERVRAVVARLGYRPDRVAQALRRQRSAMVGLSLPATGYPAALELMAALARSLAALDISLVVADGSAGVDDQAQSVERMLAQRVDALLLVRTTMSVPHPATRVATILLDSGSTGGTTDAIRTDHEAGIRQAVRHLVREGAQRIAFLGEGTASRIGAEQLAGFTAAAEAAQSVDTVLRMGPTSAAFGRATARELLEGPRPPDAFMCGSDLVAASVCSIAAGRPEPEAGPMVVGYGGADWGEAVTPRLSTIRVPAGEIATEAVRLLSLRLGGLDDDPVDILLPPSLVVRDSA